MSLLLYLAVFFMSAMSFIIRTTLSVSCRTGCHVMFRFHPNSGEIPPSSPLSSSNLQLRNRQLSSIWISASRERTDFGVRRFAAASFDGVFPLIAMSACRPLRRLDSTQIELSCKTFVPLNIRIKRGRVSRLFEGTESSERWSNSRAKQNHN